MKRFQRSSSTPIQGAYSGRDKREGIKDSSDNRELSTKQTAAVLLVDDAEINRTTVAAMLSETRYNVSSVCSGDEAISIVQCRLFDVILMDICMPGMDGVTTTKIMRKQLRLDNIPVLAFTANDLDCDDNMLLEAGMDGCVPKPVIKNQLLTLLDQWVVAGRRVKSLGL